jgi:uncharacterized protein YqgC (DUF456 family)
MQRFKALALTAALALSAGALAEPAFAAKTCGAHIRHTANRGALYGGIAGAVVGNAISDNTTGTVVGAGVGAVAGHEIWKSKARCRPHRSHRTYRHHHR